jgi:hypothetical protein
MAKTPQHITKHNSKICLDSARLGDPTSNDTLDTSHILSKPELSSTSSRPKAPDAISAARENPPSQHQHQLFFIHQTSSSLQLLILLWTTTHVILSDPSYDKSLIQYIQRTWLLYFIGAVLGECGYLLTILPSNETSRTVNMQSEPTSAWAVATLATFAAMPRTISTIVICACTTSILCHGVGVLQEPPGRGYSTKELLLSTTVLLVVTLVFTTILLAPDAIVNHDLDKSAWERRVWTRMHWCAVCVKVGMALVCYVAGAAGVWVLLFGVALSVELGLEAVMERDDDGQ